MDKTYIFDLSRRVWICSSDLYYYFHSLDNGCLVGRVNKSQPHFYLSRPGLVTTSCDIGNSVSHFSRISHTSFVPHTNQFYIY